MKKTIVLFPVLLFSCFSLFAQFDPSNLFVGVNGNYSLYRGDFQRSTFGPQLRIGYDFGEKFSAFVGYTHGLPIKTASSIEYTTDQESISVNSTIKTTFNTISLNASYSFVGDNTAAFNFYGGAGGGFVIAKSTEKPSAAPPANYFSSNQMDDEKETGFIINLHLGVQYRFNNIAPFIDGGIALPATSVNDEYVANYIPAHLVLNAGIKINFGSSGY